MPTLAAIPFANAARRSGYAWASSMRPRRTSMCLSSTIRKIRRFTSCAVRVHDRLGHHEQAQADQKKALESPFAGAPELNNFAWRLVTGPAAMRDPEQALVLARKAVALTPGAATYLNTLGVAQYRVGQYAEAIATLEKNLAASEGAADAFDLFFLAMARYQLGQRARAAPTSTAPSNGGATTRTCRSPDGPRSSTRSRPKPRPSWTAKGSTCPPMCTYPSP